MEKGGKAPGERQRAPGQRPLWPQDDTVSDDFAFLREKIKPLQPGICLLRIQNIFQKWKQKKRLFQKNKMNENWLAVGLPSGNIKVSLGAAGK